MKSILFAISAFLLFACANEEATTSPETQKTTIVHNVTAYNAASVNRSENKGDAFKINNVVIVNQKALISVSYSGGCTTHSFAAIWNGAISKSLPPQLPIVLTHNANGDMCEAYVTTTIELDLTELMDSLAYPKLTLVVMNGSNANETVNSQELVLPFPFTETTNCIIEVTAKNMICGVGLYGQIYFSLDNNPSVEGDMIFDRFLQPVEVAESLKDFKPEVGKKYKIGAVFPTKNPYLDAVTCMAYGGPSIPVKIVCVTEK